MATVLSNSYYDHKRAVGWIAAKTCSHLIMGLGPGRLHGGGLSEGELFTKLTAVLDSLFGEGRDLEIFGRAGYNTYNKNDETGGHSIAKIEVGVNAKFD